MKKSGLIIVALFLAIFAKAHVIDSETGQTGATPPPQQNADVMDAIRKPVDGVYDKIHLAQFKPISLTYIREADVMWAQLIWRNLDLTEKLNHPLYYPTTPQGKWKSLMQALMDAVSDSSEAEPLRVYNTDRCTNPYSISGLLSSLGQTQITEVLDDDGYPTGEQKTVFIAFEPREVLRYEVYEQVLIDRQRSVQEMRMISFAPMVFYTSLATGSEEPQDEEYGMGSIEARKIRRIGWFYYPEARPLLATTEVFNPANNAQRRTYDDILLMRHFSSYVAGEENVHDNRKINEYVVNGMDQRLESDRILDQIRNRESELWEF